MVLITVLVAMIRLIFVITLFDVSHQQDQALSSRNRDLYISEIDKSFGLRTGFQFLSDVEIFIAAAVAGLPGVRTLFRNLNKWKQEHSTVAIICPEIFS
jgi:hypothetical protein